VEEPRAERHANRLMEAFWGFGQMMRQQIIPSVIGEYGLDFKDFVTLISVSEGVHFPKSICQRLSMNASDVSRILDNLSKNGFVTRELDAEDSRRIKVTLTARGEAVLKTARGRIEQLFNDVELTLPPEELERFSTTLLQFQQVVRTRIAELQMQPLRGDQPSWFGKFFKSDPNHPSPTQKPTPDSS
jgi:DNA-binding MarR family transcriptional regulator